MAGYVRAVEAVDADGDGGVVTEGAVTDSSGSMGKGREEIRGIVTNLIERRDGKTRGLATSEL